MALPVGPPGPCTQPLTQAPLGDLAQQELSLSQLFPLSLFQPLSRVTPLPPTPNP